MQTVGVAIMVHKEDSIIDCINNLIDHVDQCVVVGQSDTPPELEKKIQDIPQVEYYNFGDWIDDFSAKRNFSFAKLKTDWLFWVDADDTMHGGENLRKLANDLSGNAGGAWFPYHYAIDEFGNLTTVYIRERLLRASYGWIWKGMLHETLTPLHQCEYIKTDEVIILHHGQHGGSRGDRNFRILWKMHEQDPEDRRVWLYLGHQNFAAQYWMRAAEWYLKFGQDQKAVPVERWQALCYCSKALREMKDRQAVEVALMAIDLFPQYKDGYLELAQSYFSFGEFDKAIHFAKLSDSKDLMIEPPQVIFVNPLEYTFNKFALLAECYLQKGEYQVALDYLRQAYNIRPTEQIRDTLALLDEAIFKQRVTDGIKTLAVQLLRTKELVKLPSLLAAAPAWFRETADYQTLLTGAQQHIAQIEDKPEIVKGKKKSVTVNIANALNPEQLLKKLDKQYDRITIFAPMPTPEAKQINTYCQSDIEELIVSGENRHIINLRTKDKGILCEYDHKPEYDMIVKLYIGAGYEPWNPDKIRTVGEGGSETSAAWVGHHMNRAGHRVLIYAMDNQVWDGVIYRPFQEFHPQAVPCNLFISSRRPDVFMTDIPAQQKWLWAHDIHCGQGLSPDVASSLDCIIALSHWHAEHLQRAYPFLKNCEVIDLDDNEKTYDDIWTPHVFYENEECSKLPKIAIIGDGIDTDRFKKRKVKKIPHSFIWLSSVDRGLEQVLGLWPLIREKLPDATLRIFYGWNYFNNTLWMPGQRALKEKIKELIEQDGIEWCNRVGQAQLAKELQQTEFLLYPPPHDFRETYGIAFLEAQAAGVIPIYRQNGALGETIGKRGIPLALDATPETIVDAIVQVAGDKPFCDIIRKEGYEYAMNRDWSVQTEKMLKLYKILKGGAG